MESLSSTSAKKKKAQIYFGFNDSLLNNFDQMTNELSAVENTTEKKPFEIDEFSRPRWMSSNPSDQKTDAQLQKESSIEGKFISTLLNLKNTTYPKDNAPFPFEPSMILELCDKAQSIIESQPILLDLKPPAKIFGALHGHYSDLMRYFDIWKVPFDNQSNGDIDSFDYLFLGNYVGRGPHSLEVICLLLALKIREPDSIHLLRGNLELKYMNEAFGFAEECATRLGEDPSVPTSVFNRINRVFEYLPLAAVLKEKVLFIHSGIGANLESLEQIQELKRPLKFDSGEMDCYTPQEKLVIDILFTSPRDDGGLGIDENKLKDPLAVTHIKFGADIIQNFLQRNKLEWIVRSKDCVMNGFEKFSGANLLTVFSATNYLGKHNNTGAILFLRKNFELLPKTLPPEKET